jgi:hypothetical protein
VPTSPSRRGRRRPDADTITGRVKPHDPFELIRWLALSQPDPRKALAELVQNSLDAGARHIRIVRQRDRGVPRLKVVDDGDGVIPEMDRPEALQYIATHIGHSRKRALSPEERFALMTQGQFGIGLLGFWSLGERLEVRSAVPGQRAHRLVLRRDRPDFRIEPLRGRLELDEKWTEVVVVGLHPAAMSAIRGGRAAEYLGSELRGQLLAREVSVVVEDRMARSRRYKLMTVKPPRFLGERIDGLGPVSVPGYSPIRLEVYFSGEAAESGGLSLYSAGSLVSEDFSTLGAIGLDRPPWTDSRLSGFVDFPGFQVAPGSRRGIGADDAALAFAEALLRVEGELTAVLQGFEERRSREEDDSLVKSLQRALRDFYRQRPRYAMLPVTQAEEAVDGNGDGSARAPGEGASGPEEEGPAEDAGPEIEEPDTHYLFPPGPLAAVRVAPTSLRIAVGHRRGLAAVGVDATGRPAEGVTYSWSLTEDLGELEAKPGDESRVRFLAGDRPGEAWIRVHARAEEAFATAEIPVTVDEESLACRGDEGIPEPVFVEQPGAPWRSRMIEGKWEVNTGHTDFRAMAGRPGLKLRYLAMLFAKEVVLESHQDPRLDRPMEQLIEVAAWADRRLSGRAGSGRTRD